VTFANVPKILFELLSFSLSIADDEAVFGQCREGGASLSCLWQIVVPQSIEQVGDIA